MERAKREQEERIRAETRRLHSMQMKLADMEKAEEIQKAMLMKDFLQIAIPVTELPERRSQRARRRHYNDSDCVCDEDSDDDDEDDDDEDDDDEDDESDESE